MDQNINSQDIWQISTDYKKNNFVYNNGDFYYATSDHTSSANLQSDILKGLWDGIKIDVNGDSVPFFFWRPSYGTNVTTTPRIISSKYGDGYEQRRPDGINNILIETTLNFENRDDLECLAINHFLKTRAGVESFLYIPSKPFDVLKRFLCRSWETNYITYNRQTISIKIEEVSI